MIGYSHGKSLIGTQKLAGLRAEDVANEISTSSHKNITIFKMASWSNGLKNFELNKGVRVISFSQSELEKFKLFFGINMD